MRISGKTFLIATVTAALALLVHIQVIEGYQLYTSESAFLRFFDLVIGILLLIFPPGLAALGAGLLFKNGWQTLIGVGLVINIAVSAWLGAEIWNSLHGCCDDDPVEMSRPIPLEPPQ